MKKFSVIICGMLVGVFLFCFFSSPTQASTANSMIDHDYIVNMRLDSNSALISNSYRQFVIDVTAGCVFTNAHENGGIIIRQDSLYPHTPKIGSIVTLGVQTCKIQNSSPDLELKLKKIFHVNTAKKIFITETSYHQWKNYYSSGCSYMNLFSGKDLYIHSENNYVDTDDIVYLLATPNGWERCGINKIEYFDRSKVKKFRVKKVKSESALLKWRNRSRQPIKYIIKIEKKDEYGNYSTVRKTTTNKLSRDRKKIKKLNPGTEYRVKIRAKIGSHKGDYTKYKYFQTSP